MPGESASLALFGYAITALLGLLGVFLSVIVYFVSKLVTKIDKNSDTLTEVCSDLKLIKAGLTGVEEKADKLASDFVAEVAVLKEEIEMLRARTHQLYSYLTALRLKAEIEGGWKFAASEWQMATSADFNGKSRPRS